MKFLSLMLMVTGLVLWATPATAATTPAATPAATPADDFAISVPAEPIRITPGERFSTSVRVVNRQSRPLKFLITSVTLEPADEGLLRVIDDRNSDWSDRLEFPAEVDVAATSYVEVPITGTIPTDLRPNIYFVGFTVEPVRPGDGSIDVRARGANHLALEVAGDVHRSVVINGHSVGRIHIGRELKGQFKLTNDGDATVRLRGQVRIDSALSKQNLAIIQATEATSQALLPQGRSKTFPYRWQGASLLALVKPTAEATFVDGNNGVQSVTHRGPVVLVISPLLIILITAVLVVSLIAAIIKLINRRSRQGEGPARAAFPGS